jgi:hypothetical protein
MSAAWEEKEFRLREQELLAHEAERVFSQDPASMAMQRRRTPEEREAEAGELPAMEAVAPHQLEAYFAALFSNKDVDGDGVLEPDEFVSLLQVRQLDTECLCTPGFPLISACATLAARRKDRGSGPLARLRSRGQRRRHD